jgi:hypothetical protein
LVTDTVVTGTEPQEGATLYFTCGTPSNPRVCGPEDEPGGRFDFGGNGGFDIPQGFVGPSGNPEVDADGDPVAKYVVVYDRANNPVESDGLGDPPLYDMSIRGNAEGVAATCEPPEEVEGIGGIVYGQSVHLSLDGSGSDPRMFNISGSVVVENLSINGNNANIVVCGENAKGELRYPGMRLTDDLVLGPR